jgi:hypothetical protein
MGRWFWVGLWGSGGLVCLCGAAAAGGWASIPLLAAAGWLFYNAWKAQRAGSLVINDALGREVPCASASLAGWRASLSACGA